MVVSGPALGSPSLRSLAAGKGTRGGSRGGVHGQPRPLSEARRTLSAGRYFDLDRVPLAVNFKQEGPAAMGGVTGCGEPRAEGEAGPRGAWGGRQRCAGCFVRSRKGAGQECASPGRPPAFAFPSRPRFPSGQGSEPEFGGFGVGLRTHRRGLCALQSLRRSPERRLCIRPALKACRTPAGSL